MLGDVWVLCCLLLSLEHCSGWMGSVGIGKLHAGHCPNLFIVLVVCACVRVCVLACMHACVRVGVRACVRVGVYACVRACWRACVRLII